MIVDPNYEKYSIEMLIHVTRNEISNEGCLQMIYMIHITIKWCFPYCLWKLKRNITDIYGVSGIWINPVRYTSVGAVTCDNSRSTE